MPHDESERSETSSGPVSQRTVLATQRTGMAFERTRFAADRTLMAWMRTAVALIGLGFTIYKFFQYLYQSGATAGGWQPHAPRAFAIALIGLGLVFLLVALIEYTRFLRVLSRKAKRRFPVAPPLIAAILLWIVGLLSLAAVMFRAGPI
ncbi:MAG: DUF202 domain-containing protein [Phycisphaeraceae bacterium]